MVAFERLVLGFFTKLNKKNTYFSICFCVNEIIVLPLQPNFSKETLKKRYINL